MASTEDAHEHAASQHKGIVIGLSTLAVLIAAGALIYVVAS